VNQVQFSPFRFRRRLLEACEHNDVVLEAYSPLERGRRLEHPAIVEIAQRLQRTPAQVMLRWALQHNAVVIPKSSQAERIRSNAQIFDFVLSAHDMSTLEALDQTNGSGYKLIGGQALLAVAREVSSVALSRFQQKATAARGVEFEVHARVRISHRLVRRSLSFDLTHVPTFPIETYEKTPTGPKKRRPNGYLAGLTCTSWPCQVLWAFGFAGKRGFASITYRSMSEADGLLAV